MLAWTLPEGFGFIPGILPFTLVGWLRLFKIAPRDFVRVQLAKQGDRSQKALAAQDRGPKDRSYMRKDSL